MLVAIRIPYLTGQLAQAGFYTRLTEDKRVGWQIGYLTGEAEDLIRNRSMALHWMSNEICDLHCKLEQLREYSIMPVQDTSIQTLREQDLTIRLQHAEQRRASDRALHQTATHCPHIADDTALLLNAVLNELARVRKEKVYT